MESRRFSAEQKYFLSIIIIGEIFGTNELLGIR